jgi:uncharacterized protein (DUF1499 family)
MAIGVGCGSARPDAAVGHGTVSPCPDRPNCVSSEAGDEDHRIAPFKLKGEPSSAWDDVKAVVGRLPRCSIVSATKDYLHAECKSRLFRFVDDLELRLDPATGVVAVRSAARVGYWDMGVNRGRVASLRDALKEK